MIIRVFKKTRKIKRFFLVIYLMKITNEFLNLNRTFKQHVDCLQMHCLFDVNNQQTGSWHSHSNVDVFPTLAVTVKLSRS